MKLLIIVTLLYFSIGVSSAQFPGTGSCFDDDDIVLTGNLTEHGIILLQDSLTAERFFLDSLGNQYMVNYLYERKEVLTLDHYDEKTRTDHNHYIAICSIVKWKGNKSQVVMSGYKAIYSPVECASDNGKLWLKRLYEYPNRNK